MSPPRGFSLVELVVALVVLELVIVSTIGAVIAVERLRRGAAAGAAADAARWTAWHSAEQSPSCRTGPSAAVPFTLPASASRPPLHAVLLCGR